MGILEELEVTTEDQELEQGQMEVIIDAAPDPDRGQEASSEPVQQEQEPTQPQAAAEGQEETDSAPERMVNYGALDAERNKRKELQGQVQQMEERFRQLQERVLTPPEPEVEIPQYEEDPGEHLRQRVERNEATTSSLLEQRQQQQMAEQQSRDFNDWVGRFQKEEAGFSETHSDYSEVVTQLRDSRIAEYEAVGWGKEEAKAEVIKETFNLARDAENRGISQAERFYNLAKGRGFQGGNGATPVEGSTRAPNLERIGSNMSKAKSLGPSGSSPRPTTLADLSDMNNDEFDAATEGDNWSRLMS